MQVSYYRPGAARIFFSSEGLTMLPPLFQTCHASQMAVTVAAPMGYAMAPATQVQYIQQ